MKSSGARTEPTVYSGSSLSRPPTSRLVTIAERPGSFDESVGYSDAKEDDEEEYLEEKAAMPDLSEAAVVSVGRSGGVRSLAHNLTEELDDVAGPEPATEDSDDGSDGLKPSAMAGKTTSLSAGNRPPVNGDTPAGNKILGRCLELMRARSNWMQLFDPKLVHQAVWMDIGGEQAVSIDSSSTRQVAQDTVLLLRAMRCEPQRFPSDAALKDWTPTDAGAALRKWKKKLRTSFAVSEIGADRQPIGRRAQEATGPSKVPLPQTPKKRVNEGSDTGVFTATVEASPYMQDSHMVTPRDYDSQEDSSDSDSNSGDLDYLDGDLSEEARYLSAKLEDKEHVCDYLNKLNGYARNAGAQFENGGRDAMDHVEHFLDSCKDRGLEKRLCHVRVKDIHDLEDMVNDILRCKEPNVSVISADYAKRLRLREVPDHGRSLEVRGINPGVLETRRRALVKITLGSERVYDIEMWIMNHTGVRLDLFHGTARLPDEVIVPQIKSLSAANDKLYGTQVVGGPTEDLYIPGHEWREFRLKCKRPPRDTHEVWIRRTERLVPTVTRFRRGHPTWIRLTNILAYAESRDETLFERERELYECWLAEQPPAVERRDYPTPRNILTRDAEDSGPVDESQVYCAEDMTQATDTTGKECGRRDYPLAFRAVADASDGVAVERTDRGIGVHDTSVREWRPSVEQAQRQSSTHATDDAACTESSTGVTSENIGTSVQILDEPDDRAIHTPCPTEDPECMLNATYVSAMHEIAAGVVSGRDAEEDYTGPNVQNKDLDVGQQQKLVDVLKCHENIMISSGNALSPPAYGMVPWASPFVIVLKKNGVDIRICIDYKMVNAVTAIIKYAMTLFDDLLTDMEAYLWFCLLDAGFVQQKGGWSQFAKQMQVTEELAKDASTIAAEDCERQSEAQPRLRTKFKADRESSTVMDAVSLLVNGPTGDMFANGEPDESSLVPVFDRRSFVDALCFSNETFDGCLAALDRLIQRLTECRISVSFPKSIFVQSKVDFLSHEVSSEGIQADPKKIKAVTDIPFPTAKKVYGAALYQLKDADFTPGSELTVAKRSFAALQQKVMDAPILRHFDRDKEVHVMLFANAWALSSTLMQEHNGTLHPVRFCGRVLKDAEMNYHPAEKEVLALLLLLKVCYTQLAGRTIHVSTRFSTLDWVHKSKTLFGRTTQFAVMLSPWHLLVQRVKERDCPFAQLLQAGLTSFVDLDDSLAQVASPTKGSPSIKTDSNVLYARLPRSYQGFVLSFDGSAKIEKHEWTIVTAASAYLEATTVNHTENAGMNNGSLGVIACRKGTLLTQLNRHREHTAKFQSVKYLEVVREFNVAADSLASETLEIKVSKVVSTEARLSELMALNRIQDVIYAPTAKAETEDHRSTLSKPM
ncbi:Hypothetical protein PHPALM_14681 [Phytophthora palmivora]|uniref:Reverse transcriptase/retrotransposon-derived protein RNase H-like domain-containing protein n=1 Tax=Phytophthora palmivora TaxID=4796 RepID=A0A2P4XU67_9STRA|nr:Hypothetical protein PHPALM_14681 [Phytophthora palmivora]